MARALTTQIAVYDDSDANCFYSEHVSQNGHRVQDDVSFTSSASMDPGAVASFLRAQTYEFSSVKQTR
jgi:hypothetical protein